jgi:membrane protease YdiL (CAAX protease family)
MEDGGDEMFCPSCGEQMRRSANFCPNCGEPNRKQDRVDWGPSADAGTDRDSGRQGRRAPRRGASPDAAGGGAPSGPPSGRSPTGPSPPPAGAGDTADLPQWRAYLPQGLRASNESGLRTVGVAIALAAASILVPIFAGFVLVLVGGGLFVAATGGEFGGVPDIALIAGVLLLVLAQFAWFAGFGLWYLRRRGLDRESIVSYLGIERPTGRQLALVVGAAIGMVVAAGVVNLLLTQLVELLGFEIEAAENESTQILENNPSPLLLLGGVALMMFVVGPAEELLFRGVIQGRLRERLSPAKAIVAASVLFGSVHLTALGGGSGAAGLLLTIAVLSTVALVLGSLYEYTGNLVVVALTHGLYNSILITMLYIASVTDVDTEGAMLLPDILTALPL